MGVYSFVELMGTGELAFMEQNGDVYLYQTCTDYNKRSSDLTYIYHKPQTLDLIVTKYGSSQQTYVRGLLAYFAGRPTLVVYHKTKRLLSDPMLPGFHQYYPPCGQIASDLLSH